MDKQTQIQALNEAIVLLGQTNIPLQHHNDIGNNLFGALQRVVAVAHAMDAELEAERKEEAKANAEDHHEEV